MKRFFTNWHYWAGLGTAAVLALVLPLIIIPMGLVDTSALPEPGWIEAHVGPMAMNASRRRRAPSTENPYKQDSQVMSEASSHYRANCLPCHGASGVKPSEFAEGLHPSAPHLTLPRIQALTDGQLFHTVRNGIMMTGMPGFGASHTDDEIWKIVAFVRHLPNLSDEEQAELKKSQEMDHHHPGGHGADPNGGETDHAGHEHGDAAPSSDADAAPASSKATSEPPHVHGGDSAVPAGGTDDHTEHQKPLTGSPDENPHPHTTP